MLKKLSLFLLVVILVGGVVDTWAGLTTLARRKSYSSGEVFTASDYNNDLDHFINAYNLIVPYFQGDSIKVVIVATDTLVTKAIAKIVVKDPLVSLSASDSLLFHLANIRRINADSLYIGTPLEGFSVGFTAGKRVFIGYGRADTMSIDSLSVIAGKINFSGSTITNLGTVTTADINGGTIDGTTVGAASPSTGAFTTLSATGNTSLTGTSLTVSATPVFSGGLTTNQLKVTGTSALAGRVTASAGITSTISSTFSSGITTTSLSSDATTETTSGITGAIHTDGGLGVLKDIYLGDDLLIATGAVFNWDAGDVTWTHSAAKLTLGGDGAVELDFNNHEMTNVDVNSGAIDGTTVGASSASTIAATTLAASGDVTFTGSTLTSSAVANFSVGLTAASLTATTADINAGTLDNATVGAGTPSTGAFTTLSANGNTSFTGTSMTVSATPVFSGGLTTNQLKVTGTSQLTGRVTASAGLTSTISSTFSAGLTTTGISDDATTETTSGTTGAIHTDGGLGVLKDIYVGDDLFMGSSGSVLNWNAGDITWTHSAGKLTLGGDGAVELDYNNHEQTNVDINSGAIDGTAVGAASASTGAFTSLTASGATTLNGNTTVGDASGDALTFHPAAWTLSNGVTVTGTWTNIGTVTTADINGGTVDATTLGASTPSTAAVTTLNVSGAAVIGDGADALTINASKTTVKGPFVIGRRDTTVATSVKRFEPFDLHDPNQLGKFVVGGDGKMKLVSMYDEWRQIEGSKSYVISEGKRHPDSGVKIITTNGDSLVTVDGRDQSKAFVYVGGASNAILDATPVMTSVSFLDMKELVTGTGGADATMIDWAADQVVQWDATNYSVYKGTITNRNAGSGWLAMGTSPLIVNAAVNSGDMIRSPWPFHRDAFGRQLPYWEIGTDGGQSRSSYNQSGVLSIFDDTATLDGNAIAMLPSGDIFVVQEGATRDQIDWRYRIQSVTGDAATFTETWSNQGLQSEKIKWGDAVVIADVEAIQGASGDGNNSPLMLAGGDAGLLIAHAKANDNTNGAKAYKDATINTSLIYGNAHVAFSPASSANVGNIPAIFSTAETAVTRAATVAGPNSHSWSFNGTTSVSRVADHDSLSFGNGSTDQAFSIMLWVKVVAGTATQTLVVKSTETTGLEAREYTMALGANESIYVATYDESANAAIGRYWTTPLPTGIWGLLVWTYNGSSTNAGHKISYNAVRVDDGDNATGPYTAMENLTAPLTIGARIVPGGAVGNFCKSETSPPIIVRGVIPQSVIEAEYRRGNEAIQSPTSDLLPTLAVKTLDVDKSGQHVLVTSANEVTLMSQTGAVQDTFKCTSCGTLNHAVFGPNSVGDSLEIYIGGSLKYRRIGNEVSVEALAAREYQDRSVMFGPVLEADSAGYGNFWKIQDMLSAASVVNARAGHVKGGRYNDPITSIPLGFKLWGDGVKTLVTNANLTTSPALTVATDSVNVRDMAFQTAPAGVGGGQNAVLWSGKRGMMENCIVRNADNIGLSITGSFWRGSMVTVNAADSYGASIAAGHFMLMNPVFSSGASSVVMTAAADSGRVMGGDFTKAVHIAAGAERNAIIGVMAPLISDYGTGTSKVGNP